MSARKKPWLAALLNLTLIGAGTIYNRRRVGVGVALFFGLGCLRAGEVIVALRGTPRPEWPLFVGGLFVVQVAMAIDGWHEAHALSVGEQR